MAGPRPKGNTRTGQDREFTNIENVSQSRETMDRHEKSAMAKELATTAPDLAGMDVMDRAQRMGHTMTSGEMIAKLQRINPNFVFRVSKSDDTKMGIYISFWEKQITGGYKPELVHICGMENTAHPLTGGVMPEFSIIDTAPEAVPGPDGEIRYRAFKAETRGWRTVISILLKRGIITAYDVEKHFGIIPSKDSSRWHELMMTPLELGQLRGNNDTYEPQGRAEERNDDDRRGSTEVDSYGDSGSTGTGRGNEAEARGRESGEGSADASHDPRREASGANSGGAEELQAH
jgi:hypothetical protein